MSEGRWKVTFKDGSSFHVDVPAIGLVVDAAVRKHAEARRLRCDQSYEQYWREQVWCVERAK